MEALISDIKRFAVHDGDGIRTTVFFKGCSLKCVWCHNPESIGFKPQIAYYENKCINCGECVLNCQSGAHGIKNGQHFFDANNCIGCGKCTETCFGNALFFYGKTMTVDELVPILLEDKEFYKSSGGGVTLSGGECLCQASFCAELLRRMKAAGINTAVDTCGFVSKSDFDKVIPFTDVFLYDIKAIDEDVHIKCTGYSNKIILENLKYLESKNKLCEIRIPFVPDYNSDQINKIGNFLKDLKNITKVRILPYHNYAKSKYVSLNIEHSLPNQLPSEDEIEKAIRVISSFGLCIAE